MPDKYNYARISFTFDGRQYSVRGKTRDEAVAKAERKKIELEQHKTVSGGNMTVSEWAYEWVETYKRGSVGEGQYQNYLSYIRRAIEPAIGKKTKKVSPQRSVQRFSSSQKRITPDYG